MQSPSTHESLLERLRSQEDSAAWQIFSERYGPLIRDYGRRSGLQPNDCDDLLQEVLLALTKALPAFRYDRSKGSLRAYFKTIALRAVSRKRGQNREHLCLEHVDELPHETDDPWEAAWRAHHIRRALERLTREFPERTLTAFRHYVLEEESPQATARLLGLSLDSVYQAKTRVLRRVSELIAEQVRDEG